jgi:hypothetical protein
VLQQKFPAEEFMVTTKLSFTPNTKLKDEKAGFAIMGLSYAGLALKSIKDGVINLVHFDSKDAGKGKAEIERIITKSITPDIYFRVKVTKGGKCNFSYSTDGQKFINAGEEFTAEPGRWKGAKIGIFCTRETTTNDSGYADFDWLRVEQLK